MVRDAGGKGSSTLAEASNSPESESINSQALAANAGALGAMASWAGRGGTASAAGTVFLEDSAFLEAAGFEACGLAAKPFEVAKRDAKAMAQVMENWEGLMFFMASKFNTPIVA